MLNFTPLLGAQSESAASQSLLELDGGVKVLIDVGWDESFDVEKLNALEKHVPTLSIVLLTHATIAHLAAYAHCCKHFPLFTRIPIYATIPVISLGRTLLQDLYASTPLAATTIPSSSLSETSYSFSQSTKSKSSNILLQAPTAEEIASYFSLIHPLKYSQSHQPLPSPFSPPLNGLTITAYNAGHTLGGTIWHIQHGLESIVYAVDWNQAKENTLAGAAWLGGAGGGGGEVIEQLRKPTALICSSRGAERVALAKRDEMLLDMIKSVIVKGGTVLIPTDSSARVLELAYLLEHTWRAEASKAESPFKSTGLYLASKNIGATMRYARSMFEWMDESIIREFEAIAGGTQQQPGKSDSKPGAGPFDFKHLRMLERASQIEKLLRSDSVRDGKPAGMVILASDSSLEWGFSKQVLGRIASDSRNLVILTERLGRSKEDGHKISSVGRTLWSWWEERRDGVAIEQGTGGEQLEQVHGGGRDFNMIDAKRSPLQGTELASYQQWLATQRQLQTTLQSTGPTALETADVVDDALSDSSSDSEDSETEQQGKALNMAATLGQANRKKIGLSDEDLGINILIRRKGVYDYDVRGKKGREKMFPMVIRRKRADDFGDLIRPEDYLRAEERDEIDGQDLRKAGRFDTQDTLGKKRKWDDVTTPAGRRLSNGTNKRQNTGSGLDQEDSQFLNDDGLNLEEDDVDETVEDEIIGPSKVVVSSENIALNLRLAFVDFAGLHDKRSLQLLIPQIEPRKLILVSGLPEETTALATECRRLLGGNGKSVDVYTPEIGVTVDASVDTNAWAVKLTDDLVKRLKWQKVKGLGIVTLTGRLAAASVPESIDDDEEGSKKKQKTIEPESSEQPAEQAVITISKALTTTSMMPILDVVPTSMASAARSVAQPLHVGDLRLADLRKLMLASGYTAEFRGEGTLLIDGTVAVRKTGTGRIEVESVGASSGMPVRSKDVGTFYAVKMKIYEGLAVVAGG